MEVRFMKKRGVTLIELIVVMVIIGILAAFFAPNISAWLPSYRLRSAARDLVSTMRTGQMKAVSTNLTYRVSFTLPATYVLEYRDTMNNWVQEGNTTNLPSGISISALSLSTGTNAQFNPNATSSSGSVTLRNNRGTERLLTLTSSTGRVTIQ